MITRKIGFLGAGQMATALAQGIIRAGLVPAENVLASDPDPNARKRFTAATGADCIHENHKLVSNVDVLIIAVKPSVVATVLAEISPHLGGKTLVVSIAAGVTLTTLAGHLPRGTPLVRVMPNTPCLVGCGASAFSLGPNATAEHAQLVRSLLQAVGTATEVEEKLLDAVTGLSGSGPAFVYMMIEALSDGGVRMGLPREVATRLAAQTVRGAAEMVLATGEHPAVLKDRVASPAGTTIAGIQALEARGLRAAVMAAVEAATLRSEQLRGG